MRNWIVIYNNGIIETMDRFPSDWMHLIDIGVIKYAIHTEENRVMIRDSEGCTKEIKINELANK